MKHKAPLYPITISGLFLLADQFLKFLARSYPDFSFYILPDWLGWEYFLNSGIAFSLPFPSLLLIIFTPLIILGLLVFLSKQKSPTKHFTLGILLIIAGAISNLTDRILFGATTDYFRIFTSIINLADMMIITGAGLLLAEEYKRAKKQS